MNSISMSDGASIRFLTTILVLFFLHVQAVSARAEEELPLPRFVSVKSSEANIRKGPGLQYAVKWVLVRKGIPVEIVAEFEQWRKIRDADGDEGWVHRSMLSGKRVVTILGYTHTLYKSPSIDTYPVALIDAGVHAELLECKDSWCEIRAGEYRGWIERDALWGVYPDEVIE